MADPQAQGLVKQLKDEARQLLCSEAVLVSLNQGLGGGLERDQAVSLAAPFCVAMGDSGCLCGALSGAVLATGLFLGNHHHHARRRTMRNSGLALHNAFKAAHGATCCRVLTRKVRHDKNAHFQHCARLTANAAEMAAHLILEQRPDLARSHRPPLSKDRQSQWQILWNRLAGYFN